MMFGPPFHPIVVHFPIALYLLGVLFTLGYLDQRGSGRSGRPG
jgi:uncharacterized membrane protein